MTYDQLYEHIVNYVDPRTIDMTGFVNEKLDELEAVK
jgi:hypothetical protein